MLLPLFNNEKRQRFAGIVSTASIPVFQTGGVGSAPTIRFLQKKGRFDWNNIIMDAKFLFVRKNEETKILVSFLICKAVFTDFFHAFFI